MNQKKDNYVMRGVFLGNNGDYKLCLKNLVRIFLPK